MEVNKNRNLMVRMTVNNTRQINVLLTVSDVIAMFSRGTKGG